MDPDDALVSRFAEYSCDFCWETETRRPREENPRQIFLAKSKCLTCILGQFDDPCRAMTLKGFEVLTCMCLHICQKEMGVPHFDFM